MKIIFFFLSLCVLADLYSNDFIGRTYSTETQSVTFLEDQIIYKYWDSAKHKEIIEYRDYTFIEMGKVPYIVFDDCVYDRWLILSTKGIILLYNDENDKPFFSGFLRPIFEMTLQYIEEDTFKTTSFLEEGETLYLANNLKEIDTNKPWSEGVPGHGIGEKIIMEAFTGRRFFISNGYVSYCRPDLYEKTSRLKKILVRDITTKEEYYYELEDSPNLQDVILPKFAGGIEIEIVEVYKGTKYDDTSVNFIFSN